MNRKKGIIAIIISALGFSLMNLLFLFLEIYQLYKKVSLEI